MTRVERQSLWTAIARGLPPNEKATLHERLRASELLGKSQADFVEVRVAPVVTDPQSSEEDLVKQSTRSSAPCRSGRRCRMPRQIASRNVEEPAGQV